MSVCLGVYFRVCMIVFNHVSVCVSVCVSALLICSGLLPWMVDFLGRETEPSCRAKSYVSETLTLFQAIIFAFFLSS